MSKLVRFDWAIKYLLRNKANFDILEGFLSELLKVDITIDSVLESEGNKNTLDDKFNRLDLLVHAGKKQRIIVEVQCSSQWDYLSRILYGTSKTITEHLREGSPYKNICKVISVSIVFFNLGEGKDYLYKGSTTFQGIHYQDELKLGREELIVYGPDQTPSDIFPEYYLIKVNQFNEKIRDKFDEWVYFLKTEKIEPSFQAQGIQIAAQKLDVLKLSEEKRRVYENYREGLHYDASMALPYEIGKEEGHREGLTEGREKGLAEGRKESQLQIARALKKSGLPIADILACTGLTEKELEHL